MRDENNGKIGIYSLINKIKNKYYIDSGDPLYLRISDYYQDCYFSSRSNLYIIRALSKYGINNFSLIILDYSDSDNLIKCEQKWFDLIKLEYNLSTTAGNTKGYKHTVENIIKICETFLGRKHREQVKQAMSNARIGKK